MHARTVYEIAPDGNDWTVKRRGAERAAARFEDKQPAIDRGVELCKTSNPSQLVIKRENGTIQDERTYG